MPQELLQREDVASVAQVLDGEGVAEAVGVDPLNLGFLPESVQQLAQIGPG